ncbi:MAG: hypothetical protein P8P53_14190 [Tateyamaria sp.]|nr:hypothetical protein [Tateyamaria sp.]
MTLTPCKGRTGPRDALPVPNALVFYAKIQRWAVCRMHGAGGGAFSGSQHPNYRHGVRTNLAQDIRRLASLLKSGSKDLM